MLGIRRAIRRFFGIFGTGVSGGGILTGPEIERQISLGNIDIDPYRPEFVGPNSVDLHIGDELFVYGRRSIVPPDPGNSPGHIGTRGFSYALDPSNLPELISVPKLPDGRWFLFPNVLYIGATKEWTRTQFFVPVIDGRSSLGRLGVWAHITAGRGDDGFEGRFTVEMAVVEPVILEPGGRYFQISFLPVVGARRPYVGRYQGDLGPTASRISR